MKKERIIKFPLPEYKKIFDSLTDLSYVPYCICYQYNMENGYGSFGFNTKLSKELMNYVFKTIQCYDLSKLNGSSNKTVGFYNNLEIIKELYAEAESYKTLEKKNVFLRKYNKQPQGLPKMPVFLRLVDEQYYKSSVINELLELKVFPLIQTFYTPEAGTSFILFDHTIVEKIRFFSLSNNIQFIEVESIDTIKAW